jgi:hypothetical protein
VADEGFRFSEEEQREIIQVAARLQREEGEALTRDELTQAAAEAGIESRFVEEAIRRRSVRVESATSQKRLPRLAVAGLLVAQLIGVTTVIHGGSMWEYGGIHWACLLLAAFAWGTASATSPRALGRTLATLVVVSGVLALLAGCIVTALDGPYHSRWVEYLGNLLLAESAMILLGGLLGSFLAKRPRFEQLLVSQLER